MPASKASESHPRQIAGARPSEDRNHKGLDQNLAEDAPAARSDGHANGNLARAVRRTRSEQASEVGAGGKQHDAGQSHHARQKTARWRAEIVAHQPRNNQLESQSLFFRGIL